jgi:hypothetical protein
VITLSGAYCINKGRDITHSIAKLNFLLDIVRTFLNTCYFREKVTTTNFTTSKTKKNTEKFGNQSGFLVDYYYDITTSKMAF